MSSPGGGGGRGGGPGRVLSIQSHTVRGHVGNKSAVLPLQVLGRDVDAINSVQLCAHTQYPSFKGQVLAGSDLDVLADGLDENGLLGDYSHVLTGYIGSKSFLESVATCVKRAKERRKERGESALCYVCDPVLGDEGHMYVPTELVGAYRDNLIPLADVLTPNQFEVELLVRIYFLMRIHVHTHA